MIRLLFVFGVTASVVGGSAAFAADSYDCKGLIDGENPECLCAVPIEQFNKDPAKLSNIKGDVMVTTSNQYMRVDSQSDPNVALNIGDGALFTNQSSSAFLTVGPTCGRELQGRASLVIREMAYGNGTCACGYTEVEGGSGADLAPDPVLVEEPRAGIWPLYAVLGGLVIACVAGACDGSDPVSPD